VYKLKGEEGGSQHAENHGREDPPIHTLDTDAEGKMHESDDNALANLGQHSTRKCSD